MESLDQNQAALLEILNVLKDIRGQLGGQEERLKNIENRLYSEVKDIPSTQNDTSMSTTFDLEEVRGSDRILTYET